MTSSSVSAHPSSSRPRGAWSATAIDWLLSVMTPEALYVSLKEHPFWKNRFCKGGFKLTPQLLMQPSQLERLRQLLLHTPARSEDIITLAVTQIDLWKPFEAFLADTDERQVLRSWRLMLEVVPDQRPMILAMAIAAHKNSKVMLLAKRLLKTDLIWEAANIERHESSFWRAGATLVQEHYAQLSPEDDNAANKKNKPTAAKNAKPAAREEQESSDKSQKVKKQLLELKKQLQTLQDELKNSKAEKKELDHLYREQKFLLTQAKEEWSQEKQIGRAHV